ncbi:MAG: acetyl-CoA carboxylase, carboxyltransferase subunit beta [Clostridiaceae bacterium]|nr:acetyl-CoA carboxylase, carboxyltransferase subunit beta [Clostridiaceae bacterium]
MFNKNSFIKPKLSLEGEATPQKSSSELLPSIPDRLMTACPGCKRALFVSELHENHSVCPGCGYHFRLSARERIAFIADEGSFVEHDADADARDRLSFPHYEEKLEAARKSSGEREAVITGHCTIGGNKTALFVMEPRFMMGSMSAAVGDKITRLFEYAVQQRLPVVGYTVSGGARIHEGMLSLMQMAKTSAAVGRHSDAGLFYLTILTDPTTGGVTASFAMLGDIILAEPGALIGFAGPRVIEQTMRQTLPEGFQRAEFLLEKGFVDKIAPRSEQRSLISMLLALHKEGRNDSL